MAAQTERELELSAENNLSLGHYDAALADARAARNLSRTLHNSREGHALNLIGLAYFYTGNYAGAEAAYRDALQFDRHLPDPEGEVTVLNNLGNVYYLEGDYQQAWSYYQSAIDRLAANSSASWHAHRNQITIANLGALYQRLGRYQQALDLYLGLLRSPQAMTLSEQARFATNLGALYRRLGDPAKALDSYRQAELLFRRDRHLDGEINAVKNAGIVLALDLQNYSAALESFTRAADLARSSSDHREELQARLYSAETLRRMGDLTRAQTEFEQVARTAHPLHGVEEEWKALFGLGEIAAANHSPAAALERYQGAIALIETVRARLELNTLKTDFFAGRREVYDAAISLLTSSSSSMPALLHLLEGSRARLFQDTLRPVTLRDLQTRLDDHTLLLEYWQSDRGNGVLWVRRGSAGFVPLAACDPAPLLREAAMAESAEWRSHAPEEGQCLLGGLDALRDPNIRNVIIVPDNTLQRLPFEMLVLPGQVDATRRLLIERAAVSYLPASALLASPEPSRKWRGPWSNQVLAFANPERSGVPSAAPAPAVLPDALPEVRYIASVLGGHADIYTGARALKGYLLSPPHAGYSVVHLATHAVADRVDPEQSRILFSGSSPLFLREAYSLKLKGVSLVTVATCDSEAGAMIPGEGAEGFSRAFLAAGADSTITTQWRVADAPTAEFMKQFYWLLAHGESKAVALQHAKLKFYRSHSALAHPRYWAAFVLNGSGDQSLPRVLPWSLLIVPGCFLAAAAALLLGRKRRNRPQHVL
jgi:tetratricopeptide (TPR) repeat protein